MNKEIYQYKAGESIGGEYLVHQVFGGKGKSGMGVVYLVTSKNFDFPIVLKTYQSVSNNNHEKFKKEVRTWTQIGYHPNIVRAYGIEFINYQIFILAEFIPISDFGMNSLTDYLNVGLISNRNIIKWTAQICNAMSHAIKNGLIAHRDLKPDNIMISPEQDIKITDFGISKTDEFNDYFKDETNRSFNNTLRTEDGSFVGTLYYASPDQLLNSKDVDQRSDIYSFGIILYQLVNKGKWPYKLPQSSKININEIAKAHLTGTIVEINTPFLGIIKKCLNKDREFRYQSFDDLYKDISELGRRLSIPLPPKSFSDNFSTEEFYVKARVYGSLNEFDKSLYYINEYIKNHPDSYAGFNLKGAILSKLKNLRDAELCYLKAVELFPNFTYALNNLGLIYTTNKEFEKAINFFEKAINADEYNTVAISNLSGLYLQTGEINKACGLINKALMINPQKESQIINAQSALRLALRNNITEENVLELLKKICELNPKYKILYLDFGMLCFNNQKFSDAIQYFTIVEDIFPSDTRLLFCIALSFMNLFKYNEAIEYCEKLISKNLERTKAILLKAQLMARMKKFKEAIYLIENEYKNIPKCDSYYFYLGEIYEMMCDKNKALEYYYSAKDYLIKLKNHENIKNIKLIEKKIRNLLN